MTKELNLEEVKRLYIEENKIIKEIAQIMNCGYGTIQKRVKDMGLSRNRFKKTSKEAKELKEQIKHLYIDKKLSTNQIGKFLNRDGRTIQYHLKSMGIKLRSTKKINQEEFEKLWEEGKSDKEIADYFGVKEITMKSYRTRGENSGKFNVIRYFSQKEHQLSELQEQMILGSLLGDMALRKDTKNRSINAKLFLVHSIKQEELFMKKINILGEFISSYRLCEPKPDSRTGKVYKTWRGESKAHPCFTEIYNLLYPNNKKTITKEYLDKINNPIALAYWFMDDGTYSGNIATDSFSLEECELLKEWLDNKWNIESTVQSSNHNIHIRECSRFDFESLIFPYIVPSMYYKLKYKAKLVKYPMNSGEVSQR